MLGSLAMNDINIAKLPNTGVRELSYVNIINIAKLPNRGFLNPAPYFLLLLCFAWQRVIIVNRLEIKTTVPVPSTDFS